MIKRIKFSNSYVMLMLILIVMVTNIVSCKKIKVEHSYGGWGDSNGGRSGYTMEQVDNGVIGNSIVLNSITNGQYHDANGELHKLGDERNFVRTRLAGTTNSWNADTISVEDGKEYDISMYIHNDNPSLSIVAKDVTSSFSIPGNSDTSIVVNGYITSSNANPLKYWDSVVFNSKDGSQFYLEYVSGSAIWETNGKSAGNLNDSIITAEGVKVGYNSLNGEIPGSYGTLGYVSIRVRAVYVK